jgi:hypothetical protein
VVNRVRYLVDEVIVPELENLDGIAVSMFTGGKESLSRSSGDRKPVLLRDNSRFHTFPLSQNPDRGCTRETAGGRKLYFVHVTAGDNQVYDIENMVVANGAILLKTCAGRLACRKIPVTAV